MQANELIATQLSAIAMGDREAFTKLFRACQPRMLAYAAGLLAGDGEAAEDVVDEAFLVVWQQAGRFEGSGSAEGWIRRIVRNKAIDWLRRTHGRQMLAPGNDFELSDLPDSAPNPEQAATSRSNADALSEALSTLSVDHREAIWLCYFEDKSLAEIALICGCPEGTVKTRLFHARRILRDSAIFQGISR